MFTKFKLVGNLESNFHFSFSRSKELYCRGPITNAGRSHLTKNAFGLGSLLRRTFKSYFRVTAIHKFMPTEVPDT